MANEFRIKNGLLVNDLIYANVDGTAGQAIITDGNNNLSLGDIPAANVTGLSTVATSGDFNDLINLPTIPINFTDLADVNLVAPTSGAIVKFNGTSWVVGPDLGLVEQIDSVNTLLSVTNPNGPIATLTVNENLINIANTTGTLPKARVSGLTENFINLADTPINYTGGALKYVRVNTAGTAVEFNTLSLVAETGDYGDLINAPTLSTVATTGNYTDLLNIPVNDTIDQWLELIDTPISYATQAGKVVIVNPAENGLVFEDISTLVGIGESNTASNLGTGEGVFASKVLLDLQFKSLVAGSNISLVSTGNDITISAIASGNLGDLGDVDTTTNAPVRGDVLIFDGTGWIPGRTNEWVKIDYNVSGVFNSETHSAGISLVNVLTTDANNTTIDVTFTNSKGYPPQSIIEYGYIFNQNQYIRQELTATLDYFIRPGGINGAPSPDPFGAFGDGMEIGTFKVDRDEAGAVNGGSFPTFFATHSYLVFGF